MKTIDHTTVILVTPKQSYVDWASSFDDDRLLSLDDKIFSTAYMIPDDYDELNYENRFKKNYKDIFVLKQWLEVRVAEAVIDFGNKPIIMEEYSGINLKTL